MAIKRVTGKIRNNKFVLDPGGATTRRSLSIPVIDDKDNVLHDYAQALIDDEASLVDATYQSASGLYYDKRNGNLCVNAFQGASALGDSTEKWNTLAKTSHTNGLYLATVTIEIVQSFPINPTQSDGIIAQGYDADDNLIVLKNKAIYSFQGKNMYDRFPGDNTIGKTFGCMYLGVNNAPAYNPNAITLAGTLASPLRPIATAERRPILYVAIDNSTNKIIGIGIGGEHRYQTVRFAPSGLSTNGYNTSSLITDNGTLSSQVNVRTDAISAITSTTTVACICNYMLSNPSGDNSEGHYYIREGQTSLASSTYENTFLDQNERVIVHRGHVLSGSNFSSTCDNTFTYRSTSKQEDTIANVVQSYQTSDAIDTRLMLDNARVRGATYNVKIINVSPKNTATKGQVITPTYTGKITYKAKVLSIGDSYVSNSSSIPVQTSIAEARTQLHAKYMIDVNTGAPINESFISDAATVIIADLNPGDILLTHGSIFSDIDDSFVSRLPSAGKWDCAWGLDTSSMAECGGTTSSGSLASRVNANKEHIAISPTDILSNGLSMQQFPLNLAYYYVPYSITEPNQYCSHWFDLSDDSIKTLYPGFDTDYRLGRSRTANTSLITISPTVVNVGNVPSVEPVFSDFAALSVGSSSMAISGGLAPVQKRTTSFRYGRFNKSYTQGTLVSAEAYGTALSSPNNTAIPSEFILIKN